MVQRSRPLPMRFAGCLNKMSNVQLAYESILRDHNASLLGKFHACHIEDDLSIEFARLVMQQKIAIDNAITIRKTEFPNGHIP